MCTYENWPKTGKCAMCGTITNNANRSQPVNVIPSVILSSPERESDKSNKDEWQISTQSHRYSECLLTVLNYQTIIFRFKLS